MRTTLAPFAIIAVATTAILSGCSLLGLDSVEDMHLAVGECIDDSAVSAEGESEVGVLPTVDCAEPHDAEVYYVEDLAGEELPADLTTQVEDICYDQYEPFIGGPYEESDYWISSISPTFDSWEAGDRQVACLVVGDDGEQLTGSLKGAEA